MEFAALHVRVRRSRAADAPPSPAMPARPTSFVGRADDLAKLGALLSSNRLVTIIGFGGVGKTRIALEVAERWVASQHTEAYFVDLVAHAGGAAIASRIASIVTGAGGESIRSAGELAAALGERRLLLVLDNCEHVIGEAAAVGRSVLRDCRNVSVLATSRERLGAPGETTYRLSPLRCPPGAPEDERDARRFDAVDLFVQRASSGGLELALTAHSLATIADICRRLAGSPLAIELAAARAPALGLGPLGAQSASGSCPATAVERVPRATKRSTRRSHGATRWLSAAERTVLNRTAAFAGGHPRRDRAPRLLRCAARGRTIPTLVQSLVRTSLLDTHPADDGVRYTCAAGAAAFGLARLAECGEATTIAQRRAAWEARDSPPLASRTARACRNPPPMTAALCRRRHGGPDRSLPLGRQSARAGRRLATHAARDRRHRPRVRFSDARVLGRGSGPAL